MNVLMAARHPVGGIRTFLRYVYPQPAFGDCQFTLLAPDQDLGTYLDRFVGGGRFRVVPCGESVREMAGAVRAALREGSYDMLHTHGLTTGVAGELGRMGLRVPHLLTVHDVFLPQMFYGLKGWARRWGLNLLLRRCEAIHAVGQDCADNFLGYMPLVKKARVHPILNGIDTRRFAEAEAIDAHAVLGLPRETALIGFFGRFMAQKGFRTLVDAVDILVREGVDRPFRVLTFGWGGFIREDYEYLRGKGLGDYFLQQPATDEPERWMKAMDVVAMPSRWEACPLQPMEALSAGIPIVGTNCIGLREVIGGTPALVADVGHGRSLAEHLRDTMDPSKRSEFVEFAVEAISRFDVSHMAQQLRLLYQDVAFNDRKSRG